MLGHLQAALTKTAPPASDAATEHRTLFWPRFIATEELESAVTAEGVETPDDFFRDKGPAAPGLIAFSLLDSALLPFRSVSL